MQVEGVMFAGAPHSLKLGLFLLEATGAFSQAILGEINSKIFSIYQLLNAFIVF